MLPRRCRSWCCCWCCCWCWRSRRCLLPPPSPVMLLTLCSSVPPHEVTYGEVAGNEGVKGSPAVQRYTPSVLFGGSLGAPVPTSPDAQNMAFPITPSFCSSVFNLNSTDVLLGRLATSDPDHDTVAISGPCFCPNHATAHGRNEVPLFAPTTDLVMSAAANKISESKSASIHAADALGAARDRSSSLHG